MPSHMATEQSRPLPDRVTKPLLDLITDQALDEDYRVAAARAAAGSSTRPSRPHRTAVAVVVVFGVLASTAFIQTRSNASTEEAGRSVLIDRIDAGRERVARLQERVVRLRDRNAGLDVLSVDIAGRQAPANRELRRLRTRTGFVAVTGDGLRIVVDDGPPSGEVDTTVRAGDLRLLVNGLWAAGTEAMSVNGQRLTALSAIVVSGTAISVNKTGLTAPYTLLAIGDPLTLEAELFDTSSGLAFADLAADLGFGFDIATDDDLLVPAAAPRLQRLRTVLPASSGEPGPIEQGNTQ